MAAIAWCLKISLIIKCPTYVQKRQGQKSHVEPSYENTIFLYLLSFIGTFSISKLNLILHHLSRRPLVPLWLAARLARILLL